MHVLPFFVAHPIVPWIGDRPALGDLARVPSRRAFGMRGDDEMEVVAITAYGRGDRRQHGAGR